jgi:hypothetical protein
MHSMHSGSVIWQQQVPLISGSLLVLRTMYLRNELLQAHRPSHARLPQGQRKKISGYKPLPRESVGHGRLPGDQRTNASALRSFRTVQRD